ncbi:MAG: transketolase [Synergistaceae bacterium]|nr:transketolase [Synergistaceae bacterium]
MADTKETVKELERIASRCRRSVIRMVRSSGAGHMGGAMSCMDIVAALYFHAMNVDPAYPNKPDRDRFVLSAGHKCMAQYAALAERGFFDFSELDTYGKLNTKLPGHPDMHKLPGVEANTGALGHGLSISVGMSLGLKRSHPGARVFAVMGDGELPEGSNWEAASAASHYGLDNLTVFVDDNGLQISGRTVDIMNMEPVGARFAAFGWATKDIDGNDMSEVVEALEKLPIERGRPTAVIAHTVKGKGLSFAEGKVSCHYWKPKEDELLQAERELDEAVKRGGAA